MRKQTINYSSCGRFVRGFHCQSGKYTCKRALLAHLSEKSCFLEDSARHLNHDVIFHHQRVYNFNGV